MMVAYWADSRAVPMAVEKVEMKVALLVDLMD
jgi:hypothetical protein